MAKNTLIGISALAKKVNKIYVGVGGTAKKIKKGYIGVGGTAHLFYSGDPVLLYESSTAGSQTMVLTAGKYEITLIGGGGGASGRRSSLTNTHHYAQGGVGGTLQFIANLPTSATVTVTVGGGGNTSNGTFASSGITLSGTAGSASTITGFPNLTATAGGGTAGTSTSTSSSACSLTPGKMGTNTLSGSAPSEILINNPTTITSLSATSTGNSRAVAGRPNTNWPEDNTRGKGGDSGWSSANFITMHGAAGFVRIRML